MEVNDEAMRVMEKRVKRILSEIDIPDNDKNEIKNELISNYTDASIEKARSRGASVVDRADVESVFETSEVPEEIASMYMVSYTESLIKAGIIPRSVAFIIDYGVSSILAIILTTPFIIFGSYLGGGPKGPPGPMISLLGQQYFNLLIASNLAVVFIYFIISEGFYGYTPGKWLMDLKVLRADGRKIGYKEAMVRDITKLFVLAIIADTLLMFLYGKDRQRLFDKIAGTIVIHRNKS
jgi:uncharacterized RDD family membrane protein YckC